MIRFETLLTLSVSHEYYGGPCRDFGWILPRETALALNGARMLARDVDGVLYLLYEADDGGQPLARATGATLAVGLVLANPDFGNVTESGPGLDRSVALYRNAPDPTILGAPSGVTMVGSRAGLVLQDAGRPVTVQVKNAGGTVVLEQTVAAAAGATAVSFDLGRLPSGALTVVEQ